ncbi:hypothetical protein ACETU7_34780 [Rhodococcus sp. 3Y1]
MVEGNHLGGYSASSTTFGELMVDLARIVAARMPNAETTQQQLRERSWWSGPEIYVLIDDYDLVATPSGNPVAPLLEYIPHSKDIGLHLVVPAVLVVRPEHCTSRSLREFATWRRPD